MNTQHTPKAASFTPGPWEFACDSYGKVRHSKKACVYRGDGTSAQPLVTVAARIPNWADARLIAAAPALLAALEHIANEPIGDSEASFREVHDAIVGIARAALAKAREAL